MGNTKNPAKSAKFKAAVETEDLTVRVERRKQQTGKRPQTMKLLMRIIFIRVYIYVIYVIYDIYMYIK